MARADPGAGDEEWGCRQQCRTKRRQASWKLTSRRRTAWAARARRGKNRQISGSPKAVSTGLTFSLRNGSLPPPSKRSNSPGNRRDRSVTQWKPVLCGTSRVRETREPCTPGARS